MIRINLIPYRAAVRRQQILQHVVIAAGSLMLVVLLIVGVHIYSSSTLSELQDEYVRLHEENELLQKKIGKIKDLDNLRADVEAKLAIVERLQKGRFSSLETLAGLSKALPENVWLTDISDKQGLVVVKGLGESNKAVANFMRSLDQSEIFDGITLQVIERSDVGNVPVRTFALTFNRVDPEAEANDANAKGKKP